jgi:hypothetical protein
MMKPFKSRSSTAYGGGGGAGPPPGTTGGHVPPGVDTLSWKKSWLLAHRWTALFAWGVRLRVGRSLSLTSPDPISLNVKRLPRKQFLAIWRVIHNTLGEGNDKKRQSACLPAPSFDASIPQRPRAHEPCDADAADPRHAPGQGTCRLQGPGKKGPAEGPRKRCRTQGSRLR